MALVLQQLFQLFQERHAKYGAGNIAAMGLMGVLSRLVYDKCARLQRYMQNPEEFDDETLEDTLLDVAGYAAIALLVWRRAWPIYTLTRIKTEEDLCIELRSRENSRRKN